VQNAGNLIGAGVGKIHITEQSFIKAHTIAFFSLRVRA